MTDSKDNDSLFNTPNPTELKQASKTEQPQDRAHQLGTDAAKTGLEEKPEPDQADPAELTDSQVTKVNISGH